MRIAAALTAINATKPAPAAYIELAQAAERYGYTAVWAPEVWVTDPFALLGWIGGHTTRIGLGCAVAQISARTAVATAASAVTLDSLSGGRFRLGLGVSGPRVVEGWHGRSYHRPLSHLREYLAVVRMTLDAQPVSYSGSEIRLPVPAGPDTVTPLAFPMPPRPLPVWLAGMGRNSVTLAGELADGWIAIHCPPDYMARARSWLADGAARSGRSLEGFDTAVMVLCRVDDDGDRARDLVRPVLAMYIGGMGSRNANFYSQHAARLGFRSAAAAARDAFAAGDIGKAIDAIPDELVDVLAVCGSPAHVRKRLAGYRDARVSTVIAAMVATSHRAQIEQLESFSALAADLLD
jgi:F420-dependent oxidoreductase-like protein